MKYFHKKILLFVFILAGVAKNAVALRYTVTNLTGVPVKVQLFLSDFDVSLNTLAVQTTKILRADIGPYDTKVFSDWRCMTKIMVAPFNEEQGRYVGEMKADLKEIDADQFNSTKKAVIEFTDALQSGLPPTALALRPKLALVQAVTGALAKASVGATALYGTSLCRNRDFLLILDQIMIPSIGGAPPRPATVKRIVAGEIIEEPLLKPYALSSP